MKQAVAAPLLSEALQSVRERVRRAAERADRSPRDIDLLAVSKNQPVEKILALTALGQRLFGESRVQETETKRRVVDADTQTPPLRWHLVGPLQSNKARRAIQLFDCIQSVSGPELAERLNSLGESRAQPVSCLVEVKISPEETKHGIAPEDMPRFFDRARAWPFLRWEGVMGIPPATQNPEDARPYFRALKKLSEKFLSEFVLPTPIVSMGMSQDFEIAIEEGSTLIRIGTALFGERPR